jgi:dethiobiotin synthetase
VGSTAKSLLIASTEAGAGKTVLLSALAAYWQAHYDPAALAIMKPLESGLEPGMSDRPRLQPWVPHQDPATLIPCPIDGAGLPHADLAALWQTLQQLTGQHQQILLEGLGSLGMPLTPDTTWADLAWDWRLPTVLVVPVRPGAIAQAVAHVALARQARVHLKGLVLNCCQPDSADHLEDWLSPRWVRSLTQVPVVGRLPYLADPHDATALRQAAADLELEPLLGSRPLTLGCL